MSFFLQLTLSGLAIGSVYALIALGFVIVYKATRVLNFAQGDMMMIGAFVTFTLSSTRGWPFFIALAVALVASFLFGFVVERIVLRPMLGQPIFSIIIVTIGLAWLMRGIAGMAFGHGERRITFPFSGETVRLPGVDVTLSAENIATLTMTMLVFFGFFLFFQRSRWGIAMRATASDQDVAQMMGINVNRISALAWGLAGVVGTLAGVILGMLGFLFIHVGDTALRAFPAAVLGGLDATGGAVFGGAILGVAETLFGGYLGGAYRELMAWILLIVVLLVRPFGLFGSKDIERV